MQSGNMGAKAFNKHIWQAAKDERDNGPEFVAKIAKARIFTNGMEFKHIELSNQCKNHIFLIKTSEKEY